MRKELQQQGTQVQFAIINIADGVPNQQEFINRCSFPLFQDRTDVRAWDQHGGQKDDMLIFDSQGKLAHYLPVQFTGPEITDLSTQEGYDYVKGKILSTK